MPYGPVFTSSAGGDIGGGKQYTRLRGPLLMGYSTADPGGQTISATVNPGGSAAAPMYSFFPQPNMGLYANVVTSSAGQIRGSVGGNDIMWLSSAGMGVGTTAFASTGSQSPFLYIPQTTGTQVPGVAPPVGVAGCAALAWDSVALTLEVYSTVTAAWVRLHSSSGANIVFSSS